MKITVTPTSQKLVELINIADQGIAETGKESRQYVRINILNLSPVTVWVDFGKPATITEGYPLVPAAGGPLAPGGQISCAFSDISLLNLKSEGDNADVRLLIN